MEKSVSFYERLMDGLHQFWVDLNRWVQLKCTARYYGYIENFVLIFVGFVFFFSLARQRVGKKTEKKPNTIRNTWMTRSEAILRAHQNLELDEEYAEKKVAPLADTSN